MGDELSSWARCWLAFSFFLFLTLVFNKRTFSHHFRCFLMSVCWHVSGGLPRCVCGGVMGSAKSGNVDLGGKWTAWGKPSSLPSPLMEVLRRQVTESGNSSFTLDFKHD